MASCTLDDIENLAFTDEDEINVRAPRPSVVMPKVTLIKGNKRNKMKTRQNGKQKSGKKIEIMLQYLVCL